MNITIIGFKELLDFNKINHSDFERMKSKEQAKTCHLLNLKVTTQKKPRH